MRKPIPPYRASFAKPPFARLWVSLAAAIVLLPVVPASAGDDIYSFVDERGVEHFSNVPSDARYKRVAGLKSQSTGAHQEQPHAGPAAFVPPPASDSGFSPAADPNLNQQPVFVEPPPIPDPNFAPPPPGADPAARQTQLVPGMEQAPAAPPPPGADPAQPPPLVEQNPSAAPPPEPPLPAR